MQCVSRSAARAGARPAAGRKSVVASAAARPLWFPGNPAPAHLDGTLAGDHGFDPLGFAAGDEKQLRWMVQAELQHCRWSMLGTAGILVTSIGANAGLGFPEWFDAVKVSIENSKIPFSSLVAVQFLLFNWAELKRLADFNNPGSQADGSFWGTTGVGAQFNVDFKGVENGYPGGRLFDPFGLSRGEPAVYKKYKENEVKNGRLAMIAQLGFWAQYAATGKGPIQNLNDHLADPTHVTFATNGVSVPFAFLG